LKYPIIPSIETPIIPNIEIPIIRTYALQLGTTKHPEVMPLYYTVHMERAFQGVTDYMYARLSEPTEDLLGSQNRMI
jgi:hypothetical protein